MPGYHNLSDKIRSTGFWRDTLVVLVLAFYGWMLFYHLGSHAFMDWDESIYAQVAKEALRSHHFLSFTFYGQHWFEKPPLLLWLVALGFKLFGITEFGGRFFIALFALGTIILTYYFVKKLTGSFWAAFLALASYGVCFHFFKDSFFLVFDIPVGFFIFSSLAAFWLARENQKYYWLMFACIGLGILTKSVIGIFPGLIIFIFSLLTKNFSYLKNKYFWQGAGLAALIVLPWHIWETIKFGRGFWNIYLFYHVVERYSSPIENNGGPWYYYFSLFAQNQVFEILSILALAYFLWRIISKFNDQKYLYLFISFAVIFAVFSLSKTKGIGYIVTVYPYLMSMMGIALAEILDKSPIPRLKHVAIVILPVIFFGLAFQQQQFKILSVESDRQYSENKEIAQFIQQNYPDKTVYAQSSVEANLAFDYYMGRQVPEKSAEQLNLPADYWTGNFRVFHKLNRSVYNFPSYLYIAP